MGAAGRSLPTYTSRAVGSRRQRWSDLRIRRGVRAEVRRLPQYGLPHQTELHHLLEAGERDEALQDLAEQVRAELPRREVILGMPWYPSLVVGARELTPQAALLARAAN